MIQIDIPMPKNCGECFICNEYLMCCVPCNGRGWDENDVSDYFSNGRPKWCPMKEQEAVVPCLMQDTKGIWNTCGKCGHVLKSALLNSMDENDTFFYFPKFCSECGQAVKWK